MRRFLASRRPSPAMAIAFVALLAALSGTAVALPGKNSVDSGDIKNKQVKGKDLANNAVTGKKIKNGSITGADVKDDSLTGADINESTLGQVPSANTANSANTASSANSAGNADQLGGVAANDYRRYSATLPSGKTVTGDWGDGLTAAAAGEGHWAIATFPVALPAALPGGQRQVVIPPASTTQCPGPGQAAAGFLCVYVQDISNATNPTAGNVFNPEAAGGPGGSGAHGFGIFLQATAAGTTLVSGSYAVTAP
jgi:hypothetical protein